MLFRGQTLYLMTSHFESCKARAAERMRQLTLVMRKMTRAPDDVTVLFGGDTNLRDAEVCLHPGNMSDTFRREKAFQNKKLFQKNNISENTKYQKTTIGNFR